MGKEGIGWDGLRGIWVQSKKTGREAEAMESAIHAGNYESTAHCER